MKKAIVLVSLFFVTAFNAKACDICGCGAGNSYLGILPDFNKKIAGLRYRYNQLYSHVPPDGGSSYLTTKEIYQTTEIWAGWNLGKKFRLMATVPYNFIQKSNDVKAQYKNGLGDISINGFYQLINNRKSAFENKLLAQNLWLGAGIKLPTGQYSTANRELVVNNANLFQLGTGSVDFALNIMYDIRLQDLGININSSYKMNTYNKEDYRYGNKFSLTSQLYYKIKISNTCTMAPNAGILLEQSQKDTDQNFTVDLSGGDILAGTAGLEVVFKKLAAGAGWQTPFSQNLGMGTIKAGNRFMLHMSFIL